MSPSKQEEMAPAATSGGGSNSSSNNNVNARTTPPRLSCTKYFDAMWFCYSPVHQMQQYYRSGEFDICFDKWNALFDCLKLKTKRSAEVQEILEARENAKPHIWTFRTVEEASAHWKKLFGSIVTDRRL